MDVHECFDVSSQLSIVSENWGEIKRSEVTQAADYYCALQNLFMLAQAVCLSKPKEFHFATIVMSGGR